MRKIKVAQIGTSRFSHGNAVFEVLKKHPDVFEILGYAMPEGEKEKFPECIPAFKDYPERTAEDILSDPEIEAVFVETEEIYLTKYAKKVVNAKKHLHMEKPGGLSFPDFAQMIDTAKKNNTLFHTGYMYRYNPMIMRLFERIDKGELGEIVGVEAQMSCYHGGAWRQWMNTFPGCGMLFFLGCHLIDLVFRICGEPQRVIPLTKCSGADGIHAPDFGMAVLEYPNGVSFVKATDIEKGGFKRRRLVVTGTKETVEICPLEWSCPEGQISEQTVYDSTEWATEGKHTKSEPFARYDGMLLAFASYVRGEKENPYSYDYEKELYRLVLTCCGLPL